MHPIKYATAEMVKPSENLVGQKGVENVEKKLEIFSKLNFREIVYIPFCICLISKYPFFNQMKKCLESIEIFIAHHSSDLNKFLDLLKYILEIIPIPNEKNKIKFALPFLHELEEIKCPIYKDFNIINLDMRIIFYKLSIEHILLIFRLILFEQKIVFIDDNLGRLSLIQHIFLSLLYPFQ